MATILSTLIAFNDRRWPVLTLLIAGLVTVATLMPMPDLPRALAKDGVHHFFAFGLLAAPVALARPSGWPFLLALIALWGGIIELIQPYFGRHLDPSDALANVAGILGSVIIASLLRWYVQLPSRRRDAPGG